MSVQFGKPKNQKLIPSQTKTGDKGSVCALCRGTKFLCGKSRCSVLVRYHSKNKVRPLIDSLKIGGASPPSVFIGRYGYPKISIGPMIPPVMGDTSLIDTPELWLGRSMEDIVDFRSMLVRGKYNVDVFDVESPNKIVGYTRELALSKNSVYAEAVFEKKPDGRIAFYDEAQPHGPSAPLKKFDISNPKYEQHIEKAFYDTDLKAKDAVFGLYKDGLEVSKIQKAFSVGAFGIRKNRHFVPTRWSITAVDSTLGQNMMEKTKTYPWINECRVYYTNQFDNRWVVLMMPSEWQYELIEAWYPNTTWNPYGSGISIFNSYEFYGGRTTYAEMGGCYYAARLAVNEVLNKERRQAGVVIMREAHLGYIMPIGVWNVRESVRQALKQPYQKFNTLNEALIHVSNKMDIPLQRWIRNSAVLKNQLFQKRIEIFMKIREVSCKSALSPSSLPGLDYSLNPYRGCQHGCAYCYAPNVLRIPRNKWGCFVDVKTNIPVVLSQELKKKKSGVVGLSTVTDPYQSIENKYKLSRYCLEQLLIHDFPVFVQTKSKLVLRDIDLISKFSNAEVMFSIGTLNDNERKILEPGASSINDRLNALKKCSDEGIKTAVFFGPVYPTIKIEDIEKIVDAFVENGAKEIMVDKFNLKPGIWDTLEKKFPTHKDLIKNVYYFKQIFEETKKICQEKNVKAISAF